MPQTAAIELNEVLEHVRHWSPTQRITLARCVLESLEGALSPAEGPQEQVAPPREIAGNEVIREMQARYPTLFHDSDTSWVRSWLGRAAGDQPPPTDEEVQQWIDEYRMEKYG